ncbi:unnamed protein product [Phytomonas sp. Hart1]|nr:unnamed protein product [Phytomonas sp. Hart1]|eukprot:CCW70312.1 unnamed protein product [Phytomonas sp. isolate Hart1]
MRFLASFRTQNLAYDGASSLFMGSFKSYARSATTFSVNPPFGNTHSQLVLSLSAACLVDIGSTATITLSYYLDVVEPTIRSRLRSRWGSPSSGGTSLGEPSGSPHTHDETLRLPKVFIRCVLLSPSDPKLQHADWVPAWQEYLAYRRTSDHGSAATSSSSAFARAVWGEVYPLLGVPPKKPICLRLRDSLRRRSSPVWGGDGDPSACPSAPPDGWAECFRVDGFIPINIQIQHAVRHFLRYRRPKVNTPYGGIAPNLPVSHPLDLSTRTEPLQSIHLIAVVCLDHLSEDFMDFFTKLSAITQGGGGANLDIWAFHTAQTHDRPTSRVSPAPNPIGRHFEENPETMPNYEEGGEKVECLVFNSRELVGSVYV